MGFITPLQFSETQKHVLGKLLGRSASAKGFIISAEKAASLYREFYYNESRNEQSAAVVRGQLKTLNGIALKYHAALKGLGEGARDMLIEGYQIQGSQDSYLKLARMLQRHGLDVNQLVNSTQSAMQAIQPMRSGRSRSAGADRSVLVNSIASAYRASGNRITLADNSKFVKVLRVVFELAGINISNVRQVAEGILRPGRSQNIPRSKSA